jgi:hypothetical protein
MGSDDTCFFGSDGQLSVRASSLSDFFPLLLEAALVSTLCSSNSFSAFLLLLG